MPTNSWTDGSKEIEAVEPSAVETGTTLTRRAAQSTNTTAAARAPRPAPFAVLLTGPSMRVMETGLALIAIATALIIGLGR